jgi:hypothetical protein
MAWLTSLIKTGNAAGLTIGVGNADPEESDVSHGGNTNHANLEGYRGVLYPRVLTRMLLSRTRHGRFRRLKPQDTV